MATDPYCHICRLGRLDADGFCPLCGAASPQVPRRKRWSLALGQRLGRINLSLLATLLVVGVVVGLWLVVGWLAEVVPDTDRLPAAAGQALTRGRAEPGQLLLDLAWRAFLQSLIVTTVVAVAVLVLWKRQQRRSRGDVAPKGDEG